MRSIGLARRVAVVAVAWLGVLACVAERDHFGAASGVTVSDSSGVRSVRFDGLAALQLKERSTAVTVEVGRQQGHDLHQVSGARILNGRRLAVGNSGTSEVLYFDSAGRLERQTGGSGDGPGEFRTITSFVDIVADTLTIYDVRLGRLTTLDPEGRVVRTNRLDPPSLVVDLLPLASDKQGRVLAVHGDSRIFSAQGVRQDTVPLLVIDSALGADTIGLWAGREWAFASVPMGRFRTEVGFGRSVEASGRNGRAIVGSTDRFALTVVNANGAPVMHIEATGPNRTVTDSDVERWRANRLMNQAEDLDPAVRTAIESAPHNTTYPAFSGLLLDADDRIWVGVAEEIGAPERTWVVLTADGIPSFRVVLPSSAKPLDSEGDLLVVLDETEFDEEVIRWVELSSAE